MKNYIYINLYGFCVVVIITSLVSPSLGDDLIVGSSSGQSVTFNDGATHAYDNIEVSEASTDTGTINVNQSGTTLTSSGTAVVGEAGVGTINVKSGGALSVNTMTLGSDASPASGTMNLSEGNSSYTSTGATVIGGSGTGTWNMSSAATADSGSSSTLGQSEDGTGTAAISGANTRWHTNGTLTVGGSGTGSLSVTDNALVISKTGDIGSQSTSKGNTVTISDGGQWTVNADHLTIGNSGSGTMTVENGGQALTDDGTVIGNQSTGEGTLTITGSSSDFILSGIMTVGVDGTGSLTLKDGGSFIREGGTGGITVAQNSGSTGSVIIGSAAGSDPVSPGYITAGTVSMGSGNGTTIFNHNSSNYSFVPSFSGSGTVEVYSGSTNIDGTTSDYSGSLQGIGGEFIVRGGASFTNDNTYIGYTTSSDSTLTISSGNFSANTALYAGYKGTGTVNVTSGGSISGGIPDVYVGYESGSEGTLNITESATMALSNALYAGYNGTGTVNVTSAGSLTSGVYDVYVGYGDDSTGTLNVTEAGVITLKNSEFYIGYQGDGTLNINTEGAIQTKSGSVGDQSGSKGTVNLSGQNSKWLVLEDDITVGGAGDGIVSITSGASVSSYSGTIAASAGSNGELIVNGEGSSWRNSEDMNIGESGAATVTLSYNGALTVDDNDNLGTIILAKNSGSSATINIGAKAGATAVPAGYINADTLQMEAGTVSLIFNHTNSSYEFEPNISTTGGTYVVEAYSGTTSLTGTVSLAGSINVYGGTTSLSGPVSLTGNLSVYSGEIDFENTVSTLDNSIGVDADSDGNMSLNGGDAAMTVNGQFHIGDAGAGKLIIQNGASLSTPTATLGNQSGSTGAAKLKGTSSSWKNDSDFDVGESGTGRLTLSSGAILTVQDGEGTVNVAVNEGSSGVIRMGAPGGDAAAASGQLSAANIVFGKGSGKVTFNHTSTSSSPLSFTSNISGTGSLSVQGGYTSLSGTLGNDVTATITPNSSNDAAGLFVLGTANGNFTVGEGGYLGGTGTIGTATFNSGAVLEAGSNSSTYGQLTISGDMTLGSSNGGATYNVNIDAQGQTNSVDVGETASIAEKSVVALYADQSSTYAKTTSYEILQAGTLSGTFNGVTNGNYPGNLVPSLGYANNTVTLTVANTTASVASVARTSNQIEMAKAVDELRLQSLQEQLAAAEAGASVAELVDTYSPIYAGLMFLDPADTRRALEALDGEIYASITSVMLEDSRFLREAVLAQQAPDVARYSWVQGFGSWANWDDNGNATSLTRNTGGFFAGVDGQVAEPLRVGLLAGYSYSSYDVSNRNSSAEANSLHLGAYSDLESKQTKLKLGAAYAVGFVDAGRTVAYGGFTDDPGGNYTTGTIQLFGQASHTFETPFAKLVPFAGGAFVAQTATSFLEDGDEASLLVSPDTETVYFSNIGGRVQKDFQVSGYTVALNLGASWQHLFGNDTAQIHNILQSQNEVSNIKGISLSRDTALVAAGLSLIINDNIRASLTYDGQFSNSYTDNGLNGTLRIKF
ncbi:autotransporter domain-containing protein [Flexibacterium corallicola]|uniref:autotransporter domain-containing protein n=1 Tax=Flexibacterium corallicola TaxID=3037259 RepID=UPI00286F616A|nr:autotransporter domain-containing protein [Pseudovibrio sp. M1P-2-3]